MAFLSKVRGVLKHTTAKNMMGGELSASTPAIFQAFRCMSSKIFVGGLSYQTSDDTLRQKCEQYGAVLEARIIYDRETGNSRGFGFVTFESDEAAKSAIMALDSQELDGRKLRVNQAHDRAAGGGGRGYNNFGGGGGYNFGGGGYNQGGGGGYNQGGGGGYNQGGGGSYNQGGGGGYNQGGGGGYNQGGGGYDNQGGGGGYDSQAVGGYNVQGNQAGFNIPYPVSYPPSSDFGGSNAFEAGNGVPAGGDNFNVESVENAPGLSYGGGVDQVNTANSDFPIDGEDGQQERRAS